MAISGAAGETIFRYGALGNLTETFTDLDNDQTFDKSSEEGKQYTWNIAGQLGRVDVYRRVGDYIQRDFAQYTYEHNGTGQLLIRRGCSDNIITPTYFHWDGFSPYLDGHFRSGYYAYFNSDMRFSLGDNYELDSSDPAQFFLQDEAGNVIAVADRTGALVENFEYDAWGNDLAGNFSSNLADARYFQNGKYFDTVTGLYYNQSRWYDPRLGRFLSESPISPMSEEEYVFCHNDPVNFADVNGIIAIPLWSIPFIGGGAGALGGFLGNFSYQFFNNDYINWGDCLDAANSGFESGFIGSGLAIVIGRFWPISVGSSPILLATERGRLFEKSVLEYLNLPLNNSKVMGYYKGQYMPTIPDVFWRGVTEIKDVQYITRTKQIILQMSYAAQEGLPYNLIVSPNTMRISHSLQKQLMKLGGDIYIFNPRTNMLIPYN